MENTNDAGPTTSSNALSLVSTTDLLKELKSRHHAVVFSAMIFKSNDRYDIIREYSGHRFVCLGMLSNLESLINPVENSSLGPMFE